MTTTERLHHPGTVLDGYVLQDGDCPFSDADPDDFCVDDGQPDSATVCGFSDGDRICPGSGTYTAWFCGCADRNENGLTPVALCAGHGEAARHSPFLVRLHTVRPAGMAAEWA